MRVWASLESFFCEPQRPPGAGGGRGSQNDPREPKQALVVVGHGLDRGRTIPREDPQKENKERHWRREAGERRAKFCLAGGWLSESGTQVIVV